MPEPEPLCPQQFWKGPPGRQGTTPRVPWGCAGELGHSREILGSPSICPIPFSEPRHPFLPVTLWSLCSDAAKQQIPQEERALPGLPGQATALGGLQKYF